MTILILVNFFIILTNYANSQLLSNEVPNNNVRLSVTPPLIVRGLPYQVDIECSFRKNNEPSMASVLSMVIAQSNKTDLPEFNYLASVNELEGHAHNVSHEVEVISGSIDNNGESKLHMRFMYPETHLIGLYMCEVTGFDQIGKPVSIYSTLNLVTTNITDLFDALHNAQSNITDLVNALHNAQSNLRAMQARINCQASYIEILHILPQLCTNYYQPKFYNGHEYYLSHPLNYFNYTEMQSKCGVFGGYLAELDTHEEFIFVQNYLVTIGNQSYVWTGATDEDNDGVWINKHNSTSTPFDWQSVVQNEGVSYDTTFNCQCFIGNTLPPSLRDCICFYKLEAESNMQYLCEIPRDAC